MRRPHVSFLRGAAAEVAAGATVLDVGAGDAPYAELFRAHDYLTVDWSQTGHRPERPVDIVAEAHSIPRADRSVDAIVCTQVLEHLPEPRAALQEFHRLLRPRGTLWMTTPFAWYMHEVPYDFYRYTPWGLRYLLEGAGFADIDVKPMSTSMETIAELMRHLRWIIGEGHDGLDERRAAVGDLVARLSQAVEAQSYLDTQSLLPVALSARAVRPSPVDRRGRTEASDHHQLPPA